MLWLYKRYTRTRRVLKSFVVPYLDSARVVEWLMGLGCFGGFWVAMQV